MNILSLLGITGCCRCASVECECPPPEKCVMCLGECRCDPFECIVLPCHDVVHIACADQLKLMGQCPGECALRDHPDPKQIPTWQHFLLDRIRLALQGGPPLLLEDLHDLEDWKMYWVLHRIYLHGIGVPQHEAEQAKFFKLALTHGDAQAQYATAVEHKDLIWLRRAAESGSHDAIRAMAAYYSGIPVLGHRRAADAKLAATFMARGVDPVSRCEQALAAVEFGHPDAVRLLRAARQNDAGDYWNGKMAAELAYSLIDAGKIHEAILLTTSSDTPEVLVALGMALSGLGHPRLAEKCFVKAATADAWVCLAKMAQGGIIDPEKEDQYMTLAAQNNHPDAGFYFLMKPDCSDIAKYTAMLSRARDKVFLIKCGVAFLKQGKTALAEECKRLRNALPRI